MANRYSPWKRLEIATALGIIVDPDDEWILSAYTWRISTKGYVETTVYDGPTRHTSKLHHFLVGRPLYEVVDHINRNKLDNRRENLRYINDYRSIQNSDRIDGASLIRDRRHEGRGIEVRIQRDGRLHSIAVASMEEAEAARASLIKVQGSQCI